MLAWREDQAKKPAPAAREAPPAGSFAADIVEYGKRRAAMPTIGRTLNVLHGCAAALGRDRARNSITTRDIDVWIQTLIADGQTPASIRKYLYTLQPFFKILNGPDGHNPIAKAWKPKAPKYGEPRALPYDVIARILGELPLIRKFSRYSASPSYSAYRLRVLAYTGIPPGVLGKLSPADLIDVDRGIVHLPARLKGAGVEARSIPLTEQGIAELRGFIAIGAIGPYSTSSLNRTYQAAAKRAGIVDAAGDVSTHTYDLRHSFGTAIYRLTRDIATVGRFLGHADGSPLTLRYALGANQDVDRAAAALASAHFAAAIAAQSAHPPAPALVAVAL